MSGQNGIDGSQCNINQETLQERDKIIKYNKAFVKKNKQIPPTTLDYYKFVKVHSLF